MTVEMMKKQIDSENAAKPIYKKQPNFDNFTYYDTGNSTDYLCVVASLPSKHTNIHQSRTILNLFTTVKNIHRAILTIVTIKMVITQIIKVAIRITMVTTITIIIITKITVIITGNINKTTQSTFNNCNQIMWNQSRTRQQLLIQSPPILKNSKQYHSIVQPLFNKDDTMTHHISIKTQTVPTTQPKNANQSMLTVYLVGHSMPKPTTILTCAILSK